MPIILSLFCICCAYIIYAKGNQKQKLFELEKQNKQLQNVKIGVHISFNIYLSIKEMSKKKEIETNKYNGMKKERWK